MADYPLTAERTWEGGKNGFQCRISKFKAKARDTVSLGTTGTKLEDRR